MTNRPLIYVKVIAIARQNKFSLDEAVERVSKMPKELSVTHGLTAMEPSSKKIISASVNRKAAENCYSADGGNLECIKSIL